MVSLMNLQAIDAGHGGTALGDWRGDAPAKDRVHRMPMQRMRIAKRQAADARPLREARAAHRQSPSRPTPASDGDREAHVERVPTTARFKDRITPQAIIVI
jgi:hypothetical protein